MTDNHPITPPPELVQQLCDKAILHAVDGAKRGEIEVWLIQEAFRAGSDTELEACVEWLGDAPVVYNDNGDLHPGSYLRDARRLRPLSLKEQALTALSEADQGLNESEWQQRSDTIRRAIEALPND
jgi:hypothetical protein